jgi:glycosyltransferase involved in cell wall biosynthesis
LNLLILNTFERQGGAAIATQRLHRGLRSIGLNSQMLVQVKTTDDPSVLGPRTRLREILSFLRPYLDGLLNRFYPERNKALFSSAWFPENLRSRMNELDFDLVHLFWVNRGFLRIETVRKLKKPIVWTLHDMWPFTGGCHYDDGCGKFQQSCGSCPVLHSNKDKDLSRRIWSRKRNAWNDVPIVVVATSQWLADMARDSSLFKDKRIEVIPNGIDTEVYKPIQKDVARVAYNLPQDKRLILFSAFNAASDKRKGSQYLLQALKKMSQLGWDSKAELVVIGASGGDFPEVKMKTHYIGNLHDELSQVLLYSAADVLVAPSIQENLSNTVIESLACGTPVVAFDIGGMPDMIDHQENGYLARPFEVDDLADGISWVMESEHRHDSLSLQARQKVEKNYALEAVANQYLDLYKDILQ